MGVIQLKGSMKQAGLPACSTLVGTIPSVARAGNTLSQAEFSLCSSAWLPWEQGPSTDLGPCVCFAQLLQGGWWVWGSDQVF